MSSSTRRFRLRGAIATMAAYCALLAAMAPGAAGASQQRPACPPGYELGALTFEQVLQQGLYQEPLDAGLVTVEELAAGFAGFDANGTGILCFKFTASHRYLILDEPGVK